MNSIQSERECYKENDKESVISTSTKKKLLILEASYERREYMSLSGLLI